MITEPGRSPIAYWESGDEWIGPKDLAIALCAAERFASSCSLLEVGLWKGGWSLHMAKNLGLARVSAVDPFPGLDDVRAVTCRRFELADVALDLYADWDEVPDEPVDIVHVDGEHSEAAALRDLREVDDRLSPTGVVIVDDWLTPHFPGVNSAVHLFLSERGYRIVALTEFKAYLSRAAYAEDWREWLDSRVGAVHEMPARRPDAPEGLGAGYRESAAVLAHEPLVWLGKPARSLKP